MLVAPDRLDIEAFPRLEPVRLVKDLAIVPPLLTLPGYRRIHLHLHNAFPDAVIETYLPGHVHPNTDVLLIPYDIEHVADGDCRPFETMSSVYSAHIPARTSPGHLGCTQDGPGPRMCSGGVCEARSWHRARQAFVT
jgi:hypothetical protein